MDHRVGILGPLAVRCSGGTTTEVRGQLRRQLLLVLAAARGAAVGDDDLVDRLWPVARPRHATASVRNIIAELRQLLGKQSIERTPAGYRLVPGEAPLDIDAFETLVDEARARTNRGDDSGAVALLDRALGLVRGAPFVEVADRPWAVEAIRDAAEQIALAEEFWADLRIRSTHVGREIERLHRAADRHPYRELRWRQLSSALVTLGRRTEALRVVDEARRALADYGLEPSRALIDLEQSVVAGSCRPDQPVIPSPRTPIVGRFEQLAELRSGHRIMWVNGEAGAGKTRLAAEHADRIRSLDRRVVYVGVGDGRLTSVEVLLRALDGVVEASAVIDPDDVTQRSAPDSSLSHTLASLRAAGGFGLDVILDDVDQVEPEAADFLADLIAEPIQGVRWIFTSAPNRNSPTARLESRAQRLGSVHITVGPLDEDDLSQLAADVEPGAAPHVVADCVRDVMARTDGHPALAAELLAHQLAGSPGPVPRRVACQIAGALAGMSGTQRTLVELLSVASIEVPLPVVTLAIGDGALDVLRDIDRLVMAGIARSSSGSDVAIRHDLVREAVRGALSPVTLELRRRQLIDAFVAAGDHPRPFARLLIEHGVLVSAEESALLDRTVYAALRQLDDTCAHVEAADLAATYVDMPHCESDGLDTLRTHVEAGRALIAAGQVRRGRSLLRSLWPTIEGLDAPEVGADAILALGPVETGGSGLLDKLLDDVERVVDELDETDTQRRVQLLTWAAHHLVNRGRRTEALDLLRRADSWIADPRPTWDGLVLAVRAQADTLVEGGPTRARRSYARLTDLAAETGDLPALAAAAVLAPARCFADAAIGDVRSARRRLEELGTRLPRPDIVWWSLAIHAAVALAEGSLDDADAAIAVAHEEGEHLEVAMAGPSSRVQRLLRSLHAGELASLGPLLEATATAPAAPVTVVAVYGVAAALGGDLRAADWASRRLASSGCVLRDAGMAWPQVAAFGSDLAFASRNAELARSIWTDLVPYSGTGLALGGVGYFGSADRSLAMLAATFGDFDQASQLAARARQEEIRRGAHAWIFLAEDAIRLIERAG